MLLSCGERTQEDACVCVIIYTVNSNLKQRVKPLETKDEFYIFMQKPTSNDATSLGHCWRQKNKRVYITNMLN